MRILIGALVFAGALFGQGANRVQFRDWNAPAATAKPKVACGSLRSLTSYNLSVIGATVIPAAADAPEHCRVSIMIQPEINIEVNLPSAWNGRFYMFGNGGFAGEAFDAPARVINRARGLKAGFAVAATDTGHSAAKEPGGLFRAEPAEATRFRIPLVAPYCRNRQNAGPRLLSRRAVKVLFRWLLAGRTSGTYLRTALPGRFRRHYCRLSRGGLDRHHAGAGLLDAGTRRRPPPRSEAEAPFRQRL